VVVQSNQPTAKYNYKSNWLSGQRLSYVSFPPDIPLLTHHTSYLHPPLPRNEQSILMPRLRPPLSLRKRVYRAVTQKDMVWFDTKMGAEGTVQSADGKQGPLSAGGLMLKFTKLVTFL
jgi:hypothetical protein